MKETSHPPRYQSLDIWRGAACLAVIVFHATGFRPVTNASPVWWITERLWAGVPLFFVISGYCIAASADRMQRKGDSFRAFLVRRLRRIVPPYWATLLIFGVLIGGAHAMGVPWLFSDHHRLAAIPAPGQLSAAQWVGTLTLTEQWLPHFTGAGDPLWLLGHAWTLGYEEQFYLVTGLLAFVLCRRWFLGAALVTAGVCWVYATVPAGYVHGWFLGGQWILFACGVGVFYHLAYAKGWQRALLPGGCSVAVAWAITQPSIASPEIGLPLELVVAAPFAALLVALRPMDASLIRSPLLQPLRWCGVRCYSVYLMHYPLTALAVAIAQAGQTDSIERLLLTAVPLAVTLSAGVAAVFHLAVERHFLNRPADQPVAVGHDVLRVGISVGDSISAGS